MALQNVLRRAALSMALGLCIANLANAAPCDGAGNRLTDPGFENQTPADRGGWFPFNGAMFTSEYARSGMWSMLNATVNDVAGSFQQIPAAPGSRWRLTGYGFAPVQIQGFPAGGLIQVTFFDAAGNDLGTVETAGQQFPAKTSADLNSSTPVNTWLFLDTGTATAPAGTAFIQAFTLYIDFSGNYQRVFFDDLDLRVLGVTHGGYVSSIAANAAALRRAGLITAEQQAAMVVAAARSNGGNGCTTGDQ